MKPQPAALLKQVSNGYKNQVRSVHLCFLNLDISQSSPLYPLLSVLIYLIGVTGEEALTRRPSPLPATFLPPPHGPALALSPALRPHVSDSVRAGPLLILCASAH